MKEMKRGWKRAAFLGLFLTLAWNHPVREVWAEETQAIEYQDLEGLVRQGNSEISQMIRSQEDSLADFQEMWDILKWEQLTMEQEARERKDEKIPGAELYESNAQSLKLSARAVTRIMEGMTDKRALRSTEKAAAAKTLAAKSLMSSYYQLQLQAEASQMRAQAAEAAFEGASRQLSLGMVSQGEADQAEDEMRQAQNQAAKVRDQAEQLKRDLLNMLGLADREQAVVIGEIPNPDLQAIDAINFQEDLKHAIGNDPEVLNARHERAPGTSQKKQRARQAAEAEGNAQADFAAAYETLMTARTGYDGAKAVYEGSRMAWESIKRQQQLGLLSRIQWLEGQAAALEARAAWGQASMKLLQAYENYQGLVKGLT